MAQNAIIREAGGIGTGLFRSGPCVALPPAASRPDPLFASMRFFILPQGRFKVLPAMEHAQNRHRIAIHIKGNPGTLAVVAYPKPWTNIVTRRAAEREDLESFTLGDDDIGKTGCNMR